MKIFIIAAVLLLSSLTLIHPQDSQINEKNRTIMVNGDAVVKVQPDQIIISFGIETWNIDIMTAKTENNSIMKKAISVIKEAGVEEKDIQTDYLSIEPRYNDNYNKKDFIGYFVRNTFVVTLKEASKVEDLVTKVLQSGVNYIHGVQFQSTEFKKYREEARELALKAAKEKAIKMAGTLGLTIGDPIMITEGYGGGGSWYYSSWTGWGYGYGYGSGSMNQNVTQNIAGGSGEISETIALGKISIQASVNVTFEMK
jgi:hypothetical protein